MDRDAIARAQRSQQAREAIEFERERTTALQAQVEEIVAELAGPGVDEAAFAKMSPEDVETVRALLQPESALGPDEDWLAVGGEPAETPDDAVDDNGDEVEEEISRLQAEIAVSRRRREALERYIEALGPTSQRISDFEAAWREIETAPRGSGTVELICLRLGDGVHDCPDRVEVAPGRGVEGDRWADGEEPEVDAQVTLMNVRVARLIAGERQPLDAPGDNFLVDLDLAESALPAGTRLRLGSALLEVSALPHTGCKKFRERFGLDALKWVNANRPQRLRGLNCRVLEAGSVAVGDPISVEP